MSRAVMLMLTPLLLAQAVHTRQRMPKLPEADGERHGSCGEGPRLRLLIAGDSSAAGVGVLHQRAALAHPMAELIAERAQARVDWRLVARSGMTTAQTLHLLQREDLPNFDIAVVVTGVNDIVDRVPLHHAIAARERLADWLRGALHVRHVAFAALPPVHQFPGLPQPLRWCAGSEAVRHDRALDRWAAAYPGVSRVDMGLQLEPQVMAVDGFHPGEPAYRYCAAVIAEHVAGQVWPAIRKKEETTA